MKKLLFAVLLTFPGGADAEEKESFKHYVSLKYGSVQSRVGFESDARFKNDQGKRRTSVFSGVAIHMQSFLEE